MKTLKQLGEFNFIKEIARKCFYHKSVIKGIGDDAAVVRIKKDMILLFTADMLIEDVHFKRTQPPELIGHKALACSLSDIAAMGGVPCYALVSLALPKHLKATYALGIYKGIQKTAKKFKVSVIGGDTNSGPKIIIDVSVCGIAKQQKFILRSGAQAGDKIFVTGTLGGSKHGKHLCFTPRLEQAQFLIKNYPLHAMIDISDGLISDLTHILEESKKGAVLLECMIPLSPQAASLKEAYYNGEDFELLFTVARKYASNLARKWPFKNIKLSCIGEIINSGKGIMIRSKNGSLKKIRPGGYRHF